MSVKECRICRSGLQDTEHYGVCPQCRSWLLKEIADESSFNSGIEKIRATMASLGYQIGVNADRENSAVVFRAAWEDASPAEADKGADRQKAYQKLLRDHRKHLENTNQGAAGKTRWIIQYMRYKFHQTGFQVELRMELRMTLAAYIKESRVTMTAWDVLQLGSELCTCLSQRKNPHNNINPNHIFINPFCQAGSTDASAKPFFMLEDTVFMQAQNETAYHRAPELSAGGAASVQSDIYAVGMTMYTLLNRGNPGIFAENNRSAIDPAKSGAFSQIDKRIAEVIEKAIALQSEQRYLTFHAFQSAIDALMSSNDHKKVVVFGMSASKKKGSSSKKIAAIAASAATLLLAGAVGFFVFGRGMLPMSSDVPSFEDTEAAVTTELPEEFVMPEEDGTEMPPEDTAAVTVESVTWNTSDLATTYFLNDTPDVSGLSMELHYSDGTTETVTEGFTCTPEQLTAPGEQTVTVSYGENTYEYTVVVERIATESITIKRKPNKTTYNVNESLNSAGLSIEVTRTDGSSETLSKGFNWSPKKFTKAGNQKVTVTYGGKTAEFIVTVKDISVTSISVKTKPTKTVYYVNDTLNTSGLSITAKLSDGTTQTLTQTGDFTCTPGKLTKAGEQKITVSYGGKSTSFVVQVKQSVVLTGISVAQMPNKTKYTVGDRFDSTGLVLLAKYSDGTSARITQGFSCGSPDMSKAAKYNVGVSYQGQSTTFQITVVKKTSGNSSGTQTPTPSTPQTNKNSGTCGNNLKWEYKNGTLSITGKGAMYDYNQNAPWASYTGSISKVVIGNTVTAIGDMAFSGCSSLTSVTIPSSVTSIGAEAFYGCKSLTSIAIPYSVTSLGGGAFHSCDSLRTVTISGSISAIESSTFFDCYSLTSITIPGSVTSIKSYAFAYCDSLSSVTMSDAVTSIGEGAFSDCVSLTSIAIPDSVTSIGAKAFNRCALLTSVTIPDSVTSIGESAFSDCQSLESVTIPGSVATMGKNVFYKCISLKEIILKGRNALPSDWNKYWKNECYAQVFLQP